MIASLLGVVGEGRAEGLSSGGLTGVEPVDLHGLTGSEIERRMVSRDKNFRG